jgi:hypothetical protein
MKRKSRVKKCMVPGCDRPLKLRGLCWACYQSAARLIRLGRESWESLTAKELAIQSEKKFRAPLMQAYKKKVRKSLPCTSTKK